MAAGIIQYDRNSDVMRPIVRYLQQLRDARDGLVNQLAVLTQYRNGDGSSATHYSLLAVAGEFVAGGDYADANAAAKASFDELSSLVGKLTTNSSVSDMLAALNQGCAKHGI